MNILTMSPMWGWNSNFMGGQNTLLHISMRRCLSLLASKFSTAFSMASRPSCFDCSRFSSADRNVLRALPRLAWYPRSQHCWKIKEKKKLETQTVGIEVSKIQDPIILTSSKTHVTWSQEIYMLYIMDFLVVMSFHQSSTPKKSILDCGKVLSLKR